MHGVSDALSSYLLGLAGVVLGGVIGWINISNLLMAIMLGAAGSAAGHLTKLLLDQIIKKVKNKLKKRIKK